MASKEKVYIGCKIITAEPMGQVDFECKYRGRKKDPNLHTGGKYYGIQASGYKVTYPDGYVSWSPSQTFEKSYRLLDRSEKDLMK